ncbi:hypothetical protein HMPREF9371_0546 [Neisseria shayeganii 871]|uniref:Uncharacterized protein n=1 Tax=Neisseria shayeganii 871 TaxID=1032488 RepID=G4CG07_9NEIS|nr:hypothetical protein HMPREF9371_0546 [Neisseria shayeganii 871]
MYSDFSSSLKLLSHALNISYRVGQIFVKQQNSILFKTFF